STLSQIGNGDKLGSVSGAVGGNITIQTGGQLVLQRDNTGGTIWIGNASTGGGTGNLTVTAAGQQDVNNNTPFLPMLAQSTSYGDVLLDITGTDLSIASPVTYAGNHNLTLETLGTLNVYAAITNSGSGSLTLSGHYITANPSGSISVNSLK